MSDTAIPVRAGPPRDPVHASITPEQVSDLVERFYASVREDAHLAPIFARHVLDDWVPHLATMKGFWRSVLLKTGEYDGRPVPVHVRIGGLGEADFRAWLRLFRTTVADVFDADTGAHVIDAAERIASSLWLATNGDFTTRPPDWRAESSS